MSATRSNKVPRALAATYDAITASTDGFCQEHLDAEYAELARRAVAALCRKRPSPLATGEPRTWACGVLYALGQVNFLSDNSFEPCMRLADLCARFGVGASTGGMKAKVVREALGMNRLNFEWMLPSLVKRNPLAFMLSIDGFLVDARTLPVEMQELAFAAGLVPCVVPPAEPSGVPAGRSVQSVPSDHAPRLFADPAPSVDDPEQVHHLLRAIEGCLPITAAATPALLPSLREIFTTGSIPLKWQVSRVDYAGDEGGIMCRLVGGQGDDERTVHVSITHLAFDESTPCAREISAYQKRRRMRLRRSAA